MNDEPERRDDASHGADENEATVHETDGADALGGADRGPGDDASRGDTTLDGQQLDWNAEDGPASIRSMMFHSNDDFSWPARDLDEGDPPDAIPIERSTAGPDRALPPQARPGKDGTPGAGQPPRGGPIGPTLPSGWSDAITSTDGPHYWDRLLSSERDRVRRYRRPATIVFIEVAELDRLAELWGDDVAAQSLVRVGRTVMHQIRSSDHAARIEMSRFAIFLPETNEIAAINFVERVRAAIEAALGHMAETVRLGIGWASPNDGDLDTALTLAESRLESDLAANA